MKFFIEVSLMEEGKIECAIILRALSADRGVRKECAQRFPSAREHHQIRGVSSYDNQDRQAAISQTEHHHHQRKCFPLY